MEGDEGWRRQSWCSKPNVKAALMFCFRMRASGFASKSVSPLVPLKGADFGKTGGG